MAATVEGGARSIVDCFRRGVLSLRANAGLIPLAIVQNLAFTLAVIVSLLPPVLVLGGLALLRPGGEQPVAGPDIEAWIGDVVARAGQSLLPLSLAILASLLLGLLAVAVWAWFQGGILGVMIAAERQALADAHRRAGGWRWFRTYTLRDFAGWGGRYLGRYFAWFHLVVLLSLGFAVLGVLLVAGAVAAYRTWGGGAAVGLGCGGLVPLAFLALLFAAWTILAQPAVALDGSGAVRGSAVALRVLTRRLGASIGLLLVLVVLSVVLGVVVWIAQLVVSLLSSMAGEQEFLVWTGLYLMVALGQLVASVALNLLGFSTGAALVVAEAGSSVG